MKNSLTIKKDQSKRGTGKYFHKVGNIKGSSKTKSQALKDISKEEPINYVGIEYIVLRACKCIMQIKPINTILL